MRGTNLVHIREWDGVIPLAEMHQHRAFRLLLSNRADPPAGPPPARLSLYLRTDRAQALSFGQLGTCPALNRAARDDEVGDHGLDRLSRSVERRCSDPNETLARLAP